MQNLHSYVSPPTLYLRQAAEHCPNAISIYMDIWNNLDNKNRLVINKKHIQKEYHIPLTEFLQRLSLLVEEGILFFLEDEEIILIEVAGYDLYKKDFQDLDL